MQRIMIVSDTHRRHGNLAEAIYNEGHLDMLIHLGDVEGEEEVIKSIAGCETIFIAGNYYVSLDLKVIEQEAVARGMDIVMFGHTHRPVIIVEDNITLINPGSISYPRQADGIPTYIILEINDNNEFNFELKNV